MKQQNPQQTRCKHCCTKIEHLGVKLGSQSILEDICLHLDCGQLLAVVGPNGAGKTTLLRAILGEIPYSGKIIFKVRSGLTARPQIGYVPQRLAVDSDSPISVTDFLSFDLFRGLALTSLPRAVRVRVNTNLEKVKAVHLNQRRIGDLSGGELQRVLLAMAMDPVPDLLLLDEPVSAVDPSGLAVFYEMVGDLRKKLDVSIIMITHDLQGIASVADRLVLINQKVLMEGTPQEVLSNEKLMKTFGPSLWNLARWPHCQDPSHRTL